MHGSLDQPPIVLRSSRARAIWLVVGSAIFVAIGVLLWRTAESSVVSLLSVVFFGFCGVVGLSMLIAPPRLEIGPSGLTQTVLWRTKRFAWTDIYNFRTAIIGLANKTVGFDYLAAPPKGGALRNLNTALVGVQGSLQPGWEIPPQALASLLNDARERWLAPVANTTRITPAAPSRPSLLATVTGTRIDRKAYWLATGVVFAVTLALASIPGMQRGMGSFTTLLFIRIFASRLHDFGRSGWWQLILYGTQVAAVILVGTAGGQPMGVAVGVGLLIQLIFTLVIGVIPGDREANRFGSPPNQPSPIAISETFR